MCFTLIKETFVWITPFFLFNIRYFSISKIIEVNLLVFYDKKILSAY